MNCIKLRGNKKWCEEFGEDLSLPRFIGDKKVCVNGKWVYPSHAQQLTLENISYGKVKHKIKTKNYYKRKSKRDRRTWWRSLTAEEQLEYRCNKFEKEGRPYNRDEEWSKVLRENYYLK